MTTLEAGATSWVRDAACRGSALFVTPVHESVDMRRERERRAKRVCGECSVRGACLEYALRVNERLGIWGGLTETERRARTSITLD